MLPVPTYLTASTAPVILDTPVMVSPVQVRHVISFRVVYDLPATHNYIKYLRQILHIRTSLSRFTGVVQTFEQHWFDHRQCRREQNMWLK